MFKFVSYSPTFSGGSERLLAHKLIRTIYVILSRREPYRDSGIDYQAAAVGKNAPRWIRALKQFGYWPTQTPVTV